MQQPTPAPEALRYGYQALDAIFAPKTIAVIGATEKPGSVGRTIVWNLITNPFGGTVYPVNPNRPSVLGVKAYPNIKSIPEKYFYKERYPSWKTMIPVCYMIA